MVAPTEPCSKQQPDTQRPQSEASGPDPSKILQDLRQGALEFKEYVGYLVSLELDRAKFAGKKIGLYVGLGLVGAAVACAMISAGAALLMVGLAGLIGQLFDNFFLGATILGVLLLLLLAAGGWIAYVKLTRGTLKSLHAKYALRRERQQQMFGHDIKEVARA